MSYYRNKCSTSRDLEKKVKGLQQVVYQLVGGLYNHQKQEGEIDKNLSILFSKKEPDNEENSPDGWDIYPTTRQGDFLEEKVKILEAKLSSLEKEQSENLQEFMSEILGRVRMLEFTLKELEVGIFNQKSQVCSYCELEIAKMNDSLIKKKEVNESDDISESFCSSVSKKKRNSSYLCGNE